MATLFQVGQTALNGFATDTQVLLNTNKVVDVWDAPGAAASILYDKLDGTDPDIVSASAPASTHLSNMNTGSSGVKAIAITQINDDGTTESRTISPLNIHRVIIDPLDATKSYIAYPDTVETKFEQIHASNTMASILSAANA